MELLYRIECDVQSVWFHQPGLPGSILLSLKFTFRCERIYDLIIVSLPLSVFLGQPEDEAQEHEIWSRFKDLFRPNSSF